MEKPYLKQAGLVMPKGTEIRANHICRLVGTGKLGLWRFAVMTLVGLSLQHLLWSNPE